jgi:hypothetical protein
MPMTMPLVRRILIPFLAIFAMLTYATPANAASYCSSGSGVTVCVTYNFSTRVAQARATNVSAGYLHNVYLQLGPEGQKYWASNTRALAQGHTMYATKYNVSPPSGNLVAGFKFSPGHLWFAILAYHDFTP